MSKNNNGIDYSNKETGIKGYQPKEQDYALNSQLENIAQPTDGNIGDVWTKTAEGEASYQPSGGGGISIAEINPFTYNLDKISSFKTLVGNISGILDVNFVGDSITEGGTATSPYKDNGYVGLLRQYLEGIYDDVGCGLVPTYAYNDIAEFTFTGTWSNSVNGCVATGKTTSTPTDYAEVDINASGFEIFYTKLSTGGVMSIYSNEVLLGTVDTSNATTLYGQIAQFTGLTDSLHTIKIVCDTGVIDIYGIREVKGTTGIRLNMCAKWGTRVQQCSPSSSRESIIATNPVLTVIAYIANDSAQQIPLGTYFVHLEALIQEFKALGDVLILCNGIHDVETTPIPETSYRKTCVGLATRYDCGLIDLNGLWSDIGEIAEDIGYLSGVDGVHHTDEGHEYTKNVLIRTLEL